MENKIKRKGTSLVTTITIAASVLLVSAVAVKYLTTGAKETANAKAETMALNIAEEGIGHYADFLNKVNRPASTSTADVNNFLNKTASDFLIEKAGNTLSGVKLITNNITNEKYYKSISGNGDFVITTALATGASTADAIKVKVIAYVPSKDAPSITRGLEAVIERGHDFVNVPPTGSPIGSIAGTATTLTTEKLKTCKDDNDKEDHKDDKDENGKSRFHSEDDGNGHTHEHLEKTSLKEGGWIESEKEVEGNKYHCNTQGVNKDGKEFHFEYEGTKGDDNEGRCYTYSPALVSTSSVTNTVDSCAADISTIPAETKTELDKDKEEKDKKDKENNGLGDMKDDDNQTKGIDLSNPGHNKTSSLDSYKVAFVQTVYEEEEDKKDDDNKKEDDDKTKTTVTTKTTTTTSTPKSVVVCQPDGKGGWVQVITTDLATAKKNGAVCGACQKKAVSYIKIKSTRKLGGNEK